MERKESATENKTFVETVKEQAAKGAEEMKDFAKEKAQEMVDETKANPPAPIFRLPLGHG